MTSPASRRMVAILNPRADRGRTAQLAASLQKALRCRLPLDLKLTTRPGEATTLAAQAAEQQAEAVVAIGGDGTVHEVAAGLMTVATEARPALGIIPAGSGNDVAYAVGVGKELAAWTAMLERGATRAVDVASLRTDNGRQGYAVNNVGLLLEGAINAASHRFAWPRGAGLYLRAVLQTLLRPLPVADLHLTIDGAALRRQAIMLSIANGPRSGGKFLLMPEANPGDGRLNYVLAAPVGRWRLLGKVRGAMSGRSLADPWIERGAFGRMTIRSDRPLAGHVDGEPWLRPEDEVHSLEIEVAPGALRVICEADARLANS